MSDAEREREHGDEHQVTPLELFFDLDAYSYLHLPMVAGIVLFALGLRTTLHHVGDALHTVPAVALCGGAALYLLAQIAFLRRTISRIFRRRTIGAVVLLAVIPIALVIPALAARPRRRRLLARRCVRGDRPSRVSSPGSAPRPCGLTGDRIGESRVISPNCGCTTTRAAKRWG